VTVEDGLMKWPVATNWIDSPVLGVEEEELSVIDCKVLWLFPRQDAAGSEKRG
jgi:hypothetical protein